MQGSGGRGIPRGATSRRQGGLRASCRHRFLPLLILLHLLSIQLLLIVLLLIVLLLIVLLLIVLLLIVILLIVLLLLVILLIVLLQGGLRGDGRA